MFCLEHRQYKSHNCPNADAGNVTVLVCPVCAKSIRRVPNEDENITWERHVQTNCDPSNYAKATKKPRYHQIPCLGELSALLPFQCACDVLIGAPYLGF